MAKVIHGNSSTMGSWHFTVKRFLIAKGLDDICILLNYAADLTEALQLIKQDKDSENCRMNYLIEDCGATGFCDPCYAFYTGMSAIEHPSEMDWRPRLSDWGMWRDRTLDRRSGFARI
jgi:hypothetical protein